MNKSKPYQTRTRCERLNRLIIMAALLLCSPGEVAELISLQTLRAQDPVRQSKQRQDPKTNPGLEKSDDSGNSGSVRIHGLSEPFQDANLGSPVVGIIGDYHFKEGDFVPAGATIVELRNELEQVEVTRRKVLLDAAKADLDRTRGLFKKTRSVSAEQMEEKEAFYQVALAEYEAALLQLKRRAIVAPFHGQIVDFFDLETGESAQLQTPLVRLVDSSKCVFVTHVPAAVAARLTAGATVEIQFKSGPSSETVSGELAFISPLVDPASGLLKVKAIFQNPDHKIRPGTEGTLNLLLVGKNALAGER